MIACPSCGSSFEPSHPDQKICDACDALANPVAPTAPLRKIGTYSLQHELGVGRYATSWLAQSAEGGGVILKLLRAYAPDEETVKRFLEEAKRLTQRGVLDHPALARVLDAGVHIGGSLFLVYESGGETTLADELRGRGRIVSPRAIELCAQLSLGLHELHKLGFTHLDIKPANVGVTKDDNGVEQAVLLDCATQHLLHHAGLRETGMLPIATAAYLSPEMAAGGVADSRADLYAVGVLLYQLLSGRLPVTGHTADELIESHRSQKPLKLRDVGRRLHGDLEALLQKVLSKDPNQRFNDGAELAAALRKVAPVADQATADQADEEVEDPLPVTVLPPPEPEVAPPPKPQPGSAAAAAAAASGVPAKPRAPRPPPAIKTPQKLRAIPPRKGASTRLPPKESWFTPARLAAIGIAALLAVIVSYVALRPSPAVRQQKKKKAVATAQATPPAEAAPSPAPPSGSDASTTAPAAQAANSAPAVSAAPSVAADPPAPAPRAAHAPAPPAKSATADALEPPSLEPPASSKSSRGKSSRRTASASSSNSRSTQPASFAPPPPPAPKQTASAAPASVNGQLADAQKQLRNNEAKPAMRTLFTVLGRTDLSDDQRARATRMMAEAEAAAGNKAAAIDWYRKYLRSSDDPAERARVVKQIQALNH